MHAIGWIAPACWLAHSFDHVISVAQNLGWDVEVPSATVLPSSGKFGFKRNDMLLDRVT